MSPIVHMNQKDFAEAIAVWVSDLMNANEFLKSSKSNQFARRIYIRSLITLIEGVVWTLKQACYSMKPHGQQFSAGEIAMLCDKQFKLNEGGAVKSQDSYPKLSENLKFAVKIFQRTFSADLKVDFGGSDWTLFGGTKKVRDRITHPRSEKDFEITDTEIEAAEKVALWFGVGLKEAVSVLAKTKK